MQKGRNGHGRLSERKTIVIALLIVAVLIGGYLLGQHLETSGLKEEPTGDASERLASRNTIEYNGNTYMQRGNVISILLIGVDRDSDAEELVPNRSGGQADFLRLVVIDRENRRVSQLAIDRDTMTGITILGVLGDVTGKRTEHISLSHSFGDGKEQSAELTRQAVSELLFGTRIDFYVAMNFDGIPAMNDALGGVTITIPEDLTVLDPSWTQGAEVKLRGDQAAAFLRSRTGVGDGTNASRMARQQVYMSAAARLLQDRILEDKDFIGAMFDSLSPYLVSSISRARLVQDAYNARNYERPAVITPAGQHRINERGFTEFIVDKDALLAETLELFYKKVD